MKKTTYILMFMAIAFGGCATVQSIVKSTFPYTSTLVIPAGTAGGQARSATSSASSFDQIFTGTGNNTGRIAQVRIVSARVDASNPSNQSLGVFQSMKIYISRSDGSNEALVATRSDIASTVGNSIMLDIDNTKFLDEYLKGESVKVRLEYVLRNTLTSDISVKTSLSFSAAPATTQ